MAFSTTPSAGADRLRATADNQTINALGGNDWLFSAFNASTLYGGNGHDRISFDLDVLNSNETDQRRQATGYGGNGNDWLNADLFVQSDVDQLTRFDTWQSGGGGNDSIVVNFVSRSSVQEPSFVNGYLQAYLDGGAGADNIWFEASGENGWANSEIDSGSGSDVIYIHSTLGSSNIVHAGSGADHVTAYTESMRGLTQSQIWGGTGNDVLEASVGGVGGVNNLYGEDGDDTLIADGFATGGEFNHSQVENDCHGGAGDDTIGLTAVSLGNHASARNTAFGDAGNDNITSVIRCGADDGASESALAVTIIDGGSGDDVLTASTTFGIGVEVDNDAEAGASLFGKAGNDILRVNGGVENVLNGGTGDDSITGGSGNDQIIGGSGADVLRSGGGEDAFVYLWTTGVDLTTRDTIRGFGFGDDVIDLSAIDANANRSGNQTFTFGGGTGVGRAWVEDSATGTGSIIRANNGGVEQLYILVEDGTGRDASDWSADDFLL